MGDFALPEPAGSRTVRRVKFSQDFRWISFSGQAEDCFELQQKDQALVNGGYTA